MFSRKTATVAIVAQVLVWIGTIGLTFLAVPELVPSYMTDTAGNRLTDSAGNSFISGFEKSSVEANHRYLWLAVFWIIPITIGMALQVAGPFKAICGLGDHKHQAPHIPEYQRFDAHTKGLLSAADQPMTHEAGASRATGENPDERSE